MLWIMKEVAASFLVLCFAIPFVASKLQAADSVMKYSDVRIFASSTGDLRLLQEAGLYFDHIRPHTGGFDVLLDEREVALVRGTGMPYQILVDDMIIDYLKNRALPAAKLSALSQAIEDEFPVRGLRLSNQEMTVTRNGVESKVMTGMYSLDEAVTALDSMRLVYPHLISAKQSIGSSYEGRPLWMVKISDHPDLDEPEPEVLYTALHHGSEPMGLMAVLYFMYYLLEQYGQNPEVTYLVENRQFYFVPIVNPDGYTVLSRMNRHANEKSPGIDLNRNYGYKWMDGLSYEQLHFYLGDAPFSEPETQAIRDFCVSRQFQLALNYHDGPPDIQGILYPWGFDSPAPLPDSTVFRELSTKMTELNHYPHGQIRWFTTAPGNHNDWMYGGQELEHKILALSPEMGANYLPSPDSIFIFAHKFLHTNLVLAHGPGAIPGDPIASAVEEEDKSEALPVCLSLDQNYPNPFNARTSIRFDLPSAGEVRLDLCGLSGQRVSSLVYGYHPAGSYEAVWDGKDEAGREVASGVYLYRLQAGDQEQVRKLLLLK